MKHCGARPPEGAHFPLPAEGLALRNCIGQKVESIFLGSPCVVITIVSIHTKRNLNLPRSRKRMRRARYERLLFYNWTSYTATAGPADAQPFHGTRSTKHLVEPVIIRRFYWANSSNYGASRGICAYTPFYVSSAHLQTLIDLLYHLCFTCWSESPRSRSSFSNRYFDTFLEVIFKIADLKLRGVGENCQTVKEISYKSHFNCGSKAPWGWCSFTDNGCSFVKVIFQ